MKRIFALTLAILFTIFTLPVNGLTILAEKEIKGIKVCRQAKATWVEKFDERTNPHGKKYYWLTGTFVNHDKGEDTDEWALANGYISVVPVQYDLTAYHAMQQLNTWEL